MGTLTGQTEMRANPQPAEQYTIAASLAIFSDVISALPETISVVELANNVEQTADAYVIYAGDSALDWRELSARSIEQDGSSWSPIIVVLEEGEEHLLNQTPLRDATDFIFRPLLKAELRVRIDFLLHGRKRFGALGRMHARLNRVYQDARAGAWEWDLISNEFETVGSFPQPLDREGMPAVLEPRALIPNCHPMDADKLATALQDCLNSGDSIEVEHRVVDHHGAIHYVVQRVSLIRDDNGDAVRLIGTQQNVSDQRHAEDRIEFLSHYDPVTYLPNRDFFARLVAKAVTDRRDAPGMVGVLVVGLERFKELSAGLGPKVENLLVRSLAHRLARILSEEAEVQPNLGSAQFEAIGRLGDDQFGLIVNGILHLQEIANTAREVVAELSEPYLFGGKEIFVRPKIGIATSSDIDDDSEVLLSQALQALHQLKIGGPDAFEFYSEETGNVAVPEMEAESALHRAMVSEQFELYYQPQIDLATDRIVGVEGLIRLRDPERGLLKPDQFIEVAHETGRIFDLGAWVIEESCSQIEAWKDAGIDPVPISVNVTSNEFHATQILGLVEDALAGHHIEPKLLSVEITESFIMRDTAKSAQVMRALKKLGVGLALDDFGTGYSSLSYLKDFPVDTLKIDRSFIEDISDFESGAAMSQAIIALAKALGLKVVAEGVETEGQLTVLKEQGCDVGQGYLFSVPLPASEMTRLLKDSESAQMTLLD